MPRYTPDHHKRPAQPAYRQHTATAVFLRPNGYQPRPQPFGTVTPRTDPQPTTSIHTLTSNTPMASDRLFVTPAPPGRRRGTGGDQRVYYPPCPTCGEPIITIWTYGPERHDADPCGCGLTADQVERLTTPGVR